MYQRPREFTFQTFLFLISLPNVPLDVSFLFYSITNAILTYLNLENLTAIIWFLILLDSTFNILYLSLLSYIRYRIIVDFSRLRKVFRLKISWDWRFQILRYSKGSKYQITLKITRTFVVSYNFQFDAYHYVLFHFHFQSPSILKASDTFSLQMGFHCWNSIYIYRTF